jgi:hypothetical protein
VSCASRISGSILLADAQLLRFASHRQHRSQASIGHAHHWSGTTAFSLSTHFVVCLLTIGVWQLNLSTASVIIPFGFTNLNATLERFGDCSTGALPLLHSTVNVTRNCG